MNVNNNTTLSTTFTNNTSHDDSWSNLQCDWDIFSFEDELATRKQFATEFLQNMRSKAEQIAVPEGRVNINDLEDLQADFRMLSAEKQEILTEASELKRQIKELNGDIGLLTSEDQCIQKTIEELEKEESQLVTDYKHKKIAYQKALQMFRTHFDMDIEVKDISDSSIEAHVKFGFSSDMAPIKVIVDKDTRKIISFDSGGILSKEEEERMFSKSSVSNMLCTVRERILNNFVSI
ncbi:hypothetical protein JTB14_036537 [Gonioctena quinquepunctata]|nr:hypothetical protein JTB14_036537 [Gonioctena quinquepunctata]